MNLQFFTLYMPIDLSKHVKHAWELNEASSLPPQINKPFVAFFTYIYLCYIFILSFEFKWVLSFIPNQIKHEISFKFSLVWVKLIRMPTPIYEDAIRHYINAICNTHRTNFLCTYNYLYNLKKPNHFTPINNNKNDMHVHNESMR